MMSEKDNLLNQLLMNRKAVLWAASNEVNLRIAAHSAPEDIIAAENECDGLDALCKVTDKVTLMIAAHNAPADIIAAEDERDRLLQLHANTITKFTSRAKPR